MSKQFVTKNIKLSLDFDRYVMSKPSILAKIPQGAWIVFTVKGDRKFSKESRQLGKNILSKEGKRVIEARKEGGRWVINSLVTV